MWTFLLGAALVGLGALVVVTGRRRHLPPSPFVEILDVQTEERIKKAIRDKVHPSSFLPHYGVNYDLMCEKELLREAPNMPLGALASYADLVTKACAADPEFWKHPEFDTSTLTDAELRSRVEDGDFTTPANLAFAAIFGDPERRDAVRAVLRRAGFDSVSK